MGIVKEGLKTRKSIGGSYINQNIKVEVYYLKGKGKSANVGINSIILVERVVIKTCIYLNEIHLQKLIFGNSRRNL